MDVSGYFPYEKKGESNFVGLSIYFNRKLGLFCFKIFIFHIGHLFMISWNYFRPLPPIFRKEIDNISLTLRNVAIF